jgi:DNA-directed RNA polymerase subunit RPC12/RpoP
VLTRISNDLSAFEHLCASVRRWVDIDSTERSLATFSELSRAVFQSQHPLICGRLADAEIRELVASANNALVQCRASLVCDLAVGISQGEWLQTKFAPVSRDERLSDVRCPRCNGRNLRTVHRARGRRLLSVISEDCDRCGTLVEYVGRPWRRPLVFASEDSHNLRVDVPPLRSGECGVVLINRARDLPSITWPAAGGTITFPLDAIGFRGRVTVVALSCGRRELAASYHTIFVPLVDQATAGSSSVTVPA